MDKRTKARYSPEVLAQALSRYGIDPTEVEELGGFESFTRLSARSASFMDGGAEKIANNVPYVDFDFTTL